MIRYPCELDEVRKNISAIDPGWLDKANDRTNIFLSKQKFEESSSIWSKVKPVYMLLQKNKCVFCERQFENVNYGKIEFDLEHFRPKSSVKAWPIVGRHNYEYEFETGSDHPIGYYWLAYELTNYAASCKVCNSKLKSDFFPIGGVRCTAPGPLAGEKAFLCYPLGEVDDDPEELVTFVATTAIPAGKSSFNRRRGQVIIDFFDLNTREHLHRQRAEMIILLGNSLSAISAGYGEAEDDQIIEKLLIGDYQHTACLRAFKQLWDKNTAFARKVLKACKSYYGSEEGTSAPSL